MRSWGLIALVVSAVAAGWVAVPAGQEFGHSRTILLTVSDGRDRPMIDLLPDDFVVRAGGEPRHVLSARPADYPIVLLVDTSSDRPGDFDVLRRAVVRFIDRVGGRPIVLGRISDQGAMLTRLDDNRRTVMEALEALDATSGTSTPLQGLLRAADMLAATRPPFSTIVVLSNGSDEMTEASAVQLGRALGESRARVYAIVHRRGVGDRMNPDLLDRLSEQTGGQYIPIYAPASFEPAVDRVADRLLTEILLEFLEPADAGQTDDVRVGVLRPGALVRGLGITPP